MTINKKLYNKIIDHIDKNLKPVPHYKDPTRNKKQWVNYKGKDLSFKFNNIPYYIVENIRKIFGFNDQTLYINKTIHHYIHKHIEEYESNSNK